METIFKYRKKTWKLVKEPHGFSLQCLYRTLEGTDAYNIIGYYSNIESIVMRLVKEHFVSTKDGKEMLKTINNTCSSLSEAIKASLT